MALGTGQVPRFPWAQGSYWWHVFLKTSSDSQSHFHVCSLVHLSRKKAKQNKTEKKKETPPVVPVQPLVIMIPLFSLSLSKRRVPARHSGFLCTPSPQRNQHSDDKSLNFFPVQEREDGGNVPGSFGVPSQQNACS